MTERDSGILGWKNQDPKQIPRAFQFLPMWFQNTFDYLKHVWDSFTDKNADPKTRTADPRMMIIQIFRVIIQPYK